MKIFTTLVAVSLLSLTTLIGCGPTEPEILPEEAIEAPTHGQMNHVNYTCGAGPSAGQPCHVSADCTPYCNAGPDLGLACTIDANGVNSCTKICDAGPSKGSACGTGYPACTKYCVGNASTVGQACTQNSDCGAGGTCKSPGCGGVGCVRPACWGA